MGDAPDQPTLGVPSAASRTFRAKARVIWITCAALSVMQAERRAVIAAPPPPATVGCPLGEAERKENHDIDKAEP